MKVIVDGANYQDTGLGQVVVDSVKNELIAVYGAGNVTDEKVFAVQRLMSRLGWGLDYGIYPKLKFLMLPFMCGGVASTSAFYDLVTKVKISIGTNPVVTDGNIGTYWAFDSYGCYPKYNADATITAAAIPLTDVKRWNSSEFALFRRNSNPHLQKSLMSNAAGTYSTNPPQKTLSTIRYTSGTAYFSCSVHAAIPGANVDSLNVIVNTGTGDFATEKIITDKGECFYDSQTGTVDKTTYNYMADFGLSHSYKNQDAGEMWSFSVMGFAEGLDVNEARIVRDALVELKTALNL